MRAQRQAADCRRRGWAVGGGIPCRRVADARAYPWAAGASKYVMEVRAMTGANQMPGEIRMRVNQVMPAPIRRGQGRNVRRDWDPVPKD